MGATALQQMFTAQCARIVNSKGQQPRPTRSVLALLKEVEPHLLSSSDVEPFPLDLSHCYLGNEGAVALFRTLSVFGAADSVLRVDEDNTAAVEAAPQTESSQASCHPDIFLNLSAIVVPQSGLRLEAIVALCELLSLPRACRITHIDLSGNEYVALQAGQLLVRLLGDRGPLGDGSQGRSHSFLKSPEGDPVFSQSLMSVAAGDTNVPSHFLRRIDALCEERRRKIIGHDESAVHSARVAEGEGK